MGSKEARTRVRANRSMNVTQELQFSLIYIFRTSLSSAIFVSLSLWFSRGNQLQNSSQSITTGTEYGSSKQQRRQATSGERLQNYKLLLCFL
jgi:hypothetical protein